MTSNLTTPHAIEEDQRADIYDKWFHEQVREAIADMKNTVTHKEVMNEIHARILEVNRLKNLSFEKFCMRSSTHQTE